MKLSEVKNCDTLTEQELESIVYGVTGDVDPAADAILLLGSRPEFCHERAVEAARLYHLGLAPVIIPSGGVEWEHEGEMLTEAHYMRRVLLSCGVPDEAITLENEATTTKENMMFGAVQLNRRLRIQKVRRLCIVTSANHMRRSLALAKWLLPRNLEIVGSAAPKGDWYTTKQLRTEVKLMWGLIQNGVIDDVEFSC